MILNDFNYTAAFNSLIYERFVLASDMYMYGIHMYSKFYVEWRISLYLFYMYSVVLIDLEWRVPFYLFYTYSVFQILPKLKSFFLFIYLLLSNKNWWVQLTISLSLTGVHEVDGNKEKISFLDKWAGLQITCRVAIG